MDPSILDNEMDLGILNNNLNLNRGDEIFGSRLSDTGEKGPLNFGARLSDDGENGTHRMIAKMLTKHRYGDIQFSVLSHEGTLSVLNREDILSEYGVPQSRAHAKQQLDADVKKKKKENVIYELAKINGYKKMFGDEKKRLLRYHIVATSSRVMENSSTTSVVILAVTSRKWLSGLVFLTTFRRNF